MQQGGEHFGEGETIARARGEQTRGAVNRQGKTVVRIAFDIGHEAKELDIAKQQLVFARIVAVRRDHHMAGAIEHALRLG